MDLRQQLLQQAATSLFELDDARREAIKPYEDATVTFLCQALHQRVLEANLSLEHQLSVSIPISTLYAGQYAHDAHRHSRVIDLMDACGSHAHVLNEAAVVLDRERELDQLSPTMKRFQKAMRAVDLAQNTLKSLSVARLHFMEHMVGGPEITVAEDPNSSDKGKQIQGQACLSLERTNNMCQILQ